MRGGIFFIFIFSSLLSFAQDKVTWEFTADNEVFVAKATIADGWHLYSQHVNDEIGPMPTMFDFSKNNDLKIIGKTIEPEPFKEYDENFGGELEYFKDEVLFHQKYKTQSSTELKGTVTYMVCNDVMCMPPTDVEFSIKIDK
jgi:thiol:disulfide interchange protein DsbD